MPRPSAVSSPPAIGRQNEAPTQAPAAEGSDSSFGEALRGFVGEVNGAVANAEAKSTAFAEGRSNDIHGTMISLQEADVKVRLLGNVRNRAIEAYREVMRMSG